MTASHLLGQAGHWHVNIHGIHAGIGSIRSTIPSNDIIEAAKAFEALTHEARYNGILVACGCRSRHSILNIQIFTTNVTAPNRFDTHGNNIDKVLN